MGKIASVMLAGIMALSVAGCGSNENADQKEDAPKMVCKEKTLDTPALFVYDNTGDQNHRHHWQCG